MLASRPAVDSDFFFSASNIFLCIDAMVMTAGIPVSDPGDQVTSDGLYLLPTMDVTNKGKAVAFEMDVDRGGFLEIKVPMSRSFFA